MNRIFKLFIMIASFLIISGDWETNAEEKLVYSLTLIPTGNNVALRSGEVWRPFVEILPENFASLPQVPNGYLRKWRINCGFSDMAINAQSSIQMKFEPHSGKAIIFVLPWQKQSIAYRDGERSNWFIPTGSSNPFIGGGIASLQIVTQVDYNASVSVQRLVLEGYDIKVTDPVKRATAPTPFLGSSETRVYKQDALKAALDFVHYSLRGDVALYYEFLDAKVYALDNGKEYSPYHWAPPQFDYGEISRTAYTENYNYYVYDYEEIRQIYPEWFDASREWVPESNSFLFVGTTLRKGGEAFVRDNILAFVLKYKNNEWKVVARPLSEGK